MPVSSSPLPPTTKPTEAYFFPEAKPRGKNKSRWLQEVPSKHEQYFSFSGCAIWENLELGEMGENGELAQKVPLFRPHAFFGPGIG